jgi:hypothetical protein
MQIEALRKLLNNLAELAETIGGTGVTRDLADFQRLFSGAERTTTSKFAEGLKKAKLSSEGKTFSPSVQRVHKILLAFQELLSAAKATTAAKDIALLATIVEDCRHATILDFVTSVENLRSASGDKPPKELRTELVEACVRDLHELESDNAAFDQAMLDMKNNQKIREAEMREIASRYLGYKINKKRQQAWQSIGDRQAVDARQTARKPHQVG